MGVPLIGKLSNGGDLLGQIELPPISPRCCRSSSPGERKSGVNASRKGAAAVAEDCYTSSSSEEGAPSRRRETVQRRPLSPEDACERKNLLHWMLNYLQR